MPQPGEGEVSVVIPCPSNKVGILIGKAGATHRSLQETTKCRVHIPKDAEPGQDHRNITVVGTPMQTQVCVCAVVWQCPCVVDRYHGTIQ